MSLKFLFSNCRSIFYKGADVALICFSLDDRTSLVSVKEKWIPELARHCPKVPIILVGTKCDLPEHQRIPSKDLEKIVDKIKSVEYLECSAVTYAGVERLFETAIEASFGRLRTPDILASERSDSCGLPACLKSLHR